MTIFSNKFRLIYSPHPVPALHPGKRPCLLLTESSGWSANRCFLCSCPGSHSSLRTCWVKALLLQMHGRDSLLRQPAPENYVRLGNLFIGEAYCHALPVGWGTFLRWLLLLCMLLSQYQSWCWPWIFYWSHSCFVLCIVFLVPVVYFWFWPCFYAPIFLFGLLHSVLVTIFGSVPDFTATAWPLLVLISNYSWGSSLRKDHTSLHRKGWSQGIP